MMRDLQVMGAAAEAGTEQVGKGGLCLLVMGGPGGLGGLRGARSRGAQHRLGHHHTGVMGDIIPWIT